MCGLMHTHKIRTDGVQDYFRSFLSVNLTQILTSMLTERPHIRVEDSEL